MRSIDADILTELQSGQLRPFILLELVIDSVSYCYTDCDVPITLDGKTYDLNDFTFTPVSYSSSSIVDLTKITVINLNSVMTSLFVGGTAQGSAVTLSLIVLDSDYAIVSSAKEDFFIGAIDSWSLDEQVLTFTVVSLRAQWNKKTLSKYGASCRWKIFKGVECQYAGEGTWCDRTYARCLVLGNTDNFGGFRWLPSIIDKEIWWGRVLGEEG